MPRFLQGMGKRFKFIGRALSAYGNAQAAFSLAAHVGSALTVAGLLWALFADWLRAIDPFAAVLLISGAALFLVAVSVKAALWAARRWFFKTTFPVVLYPTFGGDGKVFLNVWNKEETDEFKVVTTVFPKFDDYQHAIPLRWKDTVAEYRTIFGTASEMVHLVDYTFAPPNVDLPSDVRLVVPSFPNGESARSFPVSDYRWYKKDDYECGELRVSFGVGVVGRNMKARSFRVTARFSCFIGGPFEREVLVEIDPAPDVRFAFAVDRKFRPLWERVEPT